MRLKCFFHTLLPIIVSYLLLGVSVTYAKSEVPCYTFANISLKPIGMLPVNNARGWEAFTINGKYYLAAAQFTDNYPAGNKDINSTIFQWRGAAGFQPFQKILTHGARNWCFTTYKNNHYLMVANIQTSSDKKNPYKVNSVVYKWDGKQFVEYQKIPTYQVIDIAFMKINNELYLALASNAKSKTTSPNIYRWDGTSFKPYQTIPQSQAKALSYFSINNQHFLAVGNTVANSTLFQWKSGKFVLVQELPINNIRGVKHFKHQNNDYLAFASQNHSAIYKWQSGKFTLYKSDNSIGGRDWLYFNSGGISYLLLSHFIHDKPAGTNFNLTVYQFDKQLKKIAELPTTGLGQLINMVINKKSYVVMTKLFSNSLLYELGNDLALRNSHCMTQKILNKIRR